MFTITELWPLYCNLWLCLDLIPAVLIQVEQNLVHAVVVLVIVTIDPGIVKNIEQIVIMGGLNMAEKKPPSPIHII